MKYLKHVLAWWCVGVTVCAAAQEANGPKIPRDPLAQSQDLIANSSDGVKNKQALNTAEVALTKAEAYLKSQQKSDGGWQGEKDPPALTAIVLRAFVQDPQYSAKDEFIAKGYAKL